MGRGLIVLAAGLVVNLCLGVLYAWSVWKKALKGTDSHPAGTAMAAPNEGWVYLTDAEATWGYTLCGMVFAITMLLGGRLQDRYGPRPGVAAAGLSLALGCLICGYLQSVVGLFLGFGMFGGLAMGLGYAATTPAVVPWFPPKRRGLVVGLVVGGYGAASLYIAPLASWLMQRYGLSGSFSLFGLLFGMLILLGALGLKRAPAKRVEQLRRGSGSLVRLSPDWTTAAMLRTRQAWALILLFFLGAQAGLLVLADAASLLSQSVSGGGFFAEQAWLLPAVGGMANSIGRIGTGLYSDRIGRRRAYALNALLAAVALLWLPTVTAAGEPLYLFAGVAVILWQYGGCLALLPAFTADYFGAKHLGQNYGVVFLGWGAAFFVPLAAAYLRPILPNPEVTFYLSAVGLTLGMAGALLLDRPQRGPQ